MIRISNVLVRNKFSLGLSFLAFPMSQEGGAKILQGWRKYTEDLLPTELLPPVYNQGTVSGKLSKWEVK